MVNGVTQHVAPRRCHGTPCCDRRPHLQPTNHQPQQPHGMPCRRGTRRRRTRWHLLLLLLLLLLLRPPPLRFRHLVPRAAARPVHVPVARPCAAAPAPCPHARRRGSQQVHGLLPRAPHQALPGAALLLLLLLLLQLLLRRPGL